MELCPNFNVSFLWSFQGSSAGYNGWAAGHLCKCRQIGPAFSKIDEKMTFTSVLHRKALQLVRIHARDKWEEGIYFHHLVYVEKFLWFIIQSSLSLINLSEQSIYSIFKLSKDNENCQTTRWLNNFLFHKQRTIEAYGITAYILGEKERKNNSLLKELKNCRNTSMPQFSLFFWADFRDICSGTQEWIAFSAEWTDKNKILWLL